MKLAKDLFNFFLKLISNGNILEKILSRLNVNVCNICMANYCQGTGKFNSSCMMSSVTEKRRKKIYFAGSGFNHMKTYLERECASNPII